MLKRTVALILLAVLLLNFVACAPTQNSSGVAGTTEELRGVLNEIGTLPVATMGVSVTATQTAVKLLDWCAVTVMTKDEVIAEVKAYYETFNPVDAEMYAEQFLLVSDTCTALADESNRASALETAGLSPALTWPQAAFDLATAMGEIV